jgi:hypothetical protein
VTVRLVPVLIVLSSAIALAQAPSQDAVAHFDLGVALYKEGNYSGALAEFETSYKITPNPGVLYNIGLAHQRLFQIPEAVAALRRFLDEQPDAPADKRASAAAIVADLENLLAPVTFDISPAGAQLSIDDRPAGKAPLAAPLVLAAGRHRIVVEADGHRVERREIVVAAGVAETHAIVLELIAKTGRVRVMSSVRGATVRVDERAHGPAPLDLELPAGHHTFDFAAQGFAAHRTHLTVEPGGAHEVFGRLDRLPARRWYKRWYVWVPIGVVVAGTTALVLNREGFLDGTLGGKEL